MKTKSMKWIVVMCTLLIVSFTSGCQKKKVAEDEVEKFWNEQASEEAMLVSENEQLQLYFQPDTSYFHVKNKKTGYTWYSNPVAADEDKRANKTNKALLKSTLIINYCDDKGVLQNMDNYTYSIKNQQFEYEKIENGVRVKYTIGALEDGKRLLPEAMTKKRFDEIFGEKLSKADLSLMGKRYKLLDIEDLDDKEKKLYLGQYPIIETEPIYIARTGATKLPEYLNERLEESAKNIGYTADDLEHDKELVGVLVKDETIFNVTLEYVLDEDGLSVRMPSDEIRYPSTNVLTDISLLEYMGASNNDEGYLFVPDGAGAIINFNNGKLKARKYVSQVYGDDPIIQRLEQTSKKEAIRFPVFGIQHKDNGFLAVIEDGEAFANIQADIGGRTHSYNYVNARFNVIPNKISELNSGFRNYQNGIWEGTFKVKYLFLEPEQSGYVQMAKAYQRYLKDKGLLTAKRDGQKKFIVEVLGAIKTNKQFIGIPYEGKTVMTSYTDTLELLANLKTGGVENIALQYADIAGQGVDVYTASLNANKAMGGDKALDALYQYTQKENIDFSIGMNLTTKKDNQLFDGYKENRDAVRQLDATVAEIKPYSEIFFTTVLNSDPTYYIRPNQYVDRFQRTWKTKDSKYDLGVILNDIGDKVYGDFNEKRTITRQDAVTNQEEVLEVAAGVNGKVNVQGGNAYALPYASSITNIPLDSSHFNIFDKNVPFMQIVLHGYKNYAGEPMNLAQDYTNNMLKTVELGADIYYKWVVQDTSNIKESELDELYSVGYQNWIMEGVQLYHELNEQLGDTNNQEIMNHEEIMQDVTKTTYESGAYVIVNYRNTSIEIDGVRIKSKSYYIHP